VQDYNNNFLKTNNVKIQDNDTFDRKLFSFHLFLFKTELLDYTNVIKDIFYNILIYSKGLPIGV